MGIQFTSNNSVSDSLGYATMLLPATGCMLVKLLTHKKDTPAKQFYMFYLIAVGVLFAMITFGVLFSIKIETLCLMMVFAMSIVGYFFLLAMPGEERSLAGLNVNINFKKSILYILLFIILFVAMVSIQFGYSFLMTGERNYLLVHIIKWNQIPIIFVNFFVTYIVVLGEEYGWRYFLQPILTRKYGDRIGILIIGVIWSFFHIPIDFIGHNLPPEQLLTRLVVCISMAFFMGWVYVNTQNIWAVAFIHYLNNTLGTLWEMPENITFLSTYSSLALYGIVFLPFVFSKSFKSKKKFEGKL